MHVLWMTYYINAMCKLHVLSSSISSRLHLHTVTHMLEIAATNNYTLDHICNNYRPQPIMLKFLPIMLLSNAQKIYPLCSILFP